MQVVFLGTATSYGVPQVACRCGTCTSPDPKNFRTRASIYVETDEGVRLVVDTSPELRVQSLREGITHVDAVLYTHYHADHTAGIDDLKAFNATRGGILPCYGDADTGESLRQRFAYAFEGTPWIGLIPHITFTTVDRDVFCVGRTAVQPIPMQHGLIRATGYRIGDFAYLTDTNYVPASSRALLKGLDTLVLDTFGWDPHPTHLSMPKALALIEELQPHRAILTHVSHALEHEETNSRLPPAVEVAYDGMRLISPPLL